MLDDILRELGTRSVFRIGSRFVGKRVIAPVAFTVGAISAAKTIGKYAGKSEFIAAREPIVEERDKWSSAISCLGSQPFTVGYIGSVHEGGAINALAEKHYLIEPGRWDWDERTPDRVILVEPAKHHDTIKPDIETARDLIATAVQYLERVRDFYDVREEVLCSARREYEKIYRSLEMMKSKDTLGDVREKVIADLENMLSEFPRNDGVYTAFQQRMSDDVQRMNIIMQDYHAIANAIEGYWLRNVAKGVGMAGLAFGIGSVIGKKDD